MKRNLGLVTVMAVVVTLLGNLSTTSHSSAQQPASADLLKVAMSSPFASGAMNVIIVSSSGGNFTSVQAALNSITNSSGRNPYLIWVGPGTYYEQVTMKQYVDIEGAGETVTKITFTGSSTLDTGTVIGANRAELRFLTVENTGANPHATAIYNSGTSPSLLHVTASVMNSSSGCIGIANYNVSSPNMRNVTARGVNCGSSLGVYNESGSAPTMTNVIATGTGGQANYGIGSYGAAPIMNNVTATGSGGGFNYGVYNDNSSSAMSNVTASGSGPSGSNNWGIRNANGGVPIMNNVTATASGGANSYGVQNLNLPGTEIKMTNVIASASGATTNLAVQNDRTMSTMTNVTAKAVDGSTSFGVSNTGGGTVTLLNSTITGGSFGLYSQANGGNAPLLVQNSQIAGTGFTIYVEPGSTAKVGSSYLNGGPVGGSGTRVCAGNYDENYTFYPSTCP